MPAGPSYDSRGLVNLVAEIESRMIGSAPMPGLHPEIAALVPEGRAYVLVVFDGLGVAQLDHHAGRSMLSAHQATLEAPFPTTTSVSLATVATGLPPSQHGLVAHLAWLEELGRVVNTLKWVDLSGQPVAHDYAAVLPGPNLWERLRRGGVEPITVQPAQFAGSPLSRLLYRGARFEAAWDDHDLVEATVQLASERDRFVFAYVWQLDYAGHVFGLDSREFDEAMRLASDVWEGLTAGLPPDVTLLGTADHGLVEYREEDKVLVRRKELETVRFAGDPRGVHVWGEDALLELVATMTGGLLTDPFDLLGPDPVAETVRRVGQRLLLAPEGRVILPPGFDKRLRSYHGGLARAEVEIPLLVG
ncbi:MAG: alkaline phosphatase family protein [Acidimicrobiia bacterium]